MKILCVGDIHAKPWVVHAVSTLLDDYDRVIFLGDYVDDWGADPLLSMEALEAISVLMRRNENKVVVLRGNHDFSEYYGYRKREFMCSGFNIGTHNECQLLYQNNWDKMLTCYIVHGYDDEASQDYYITHAGLINGWYKQWSKGFSKLAHEQKAKTSLCDTEEMLAMVGSARGGSSLYPSPIWADERELKASPIPFANQIVGHTPVKTVTCHEFKNGDGERHKIFFCDTFSTYSNGDPYGDGSCLSLDTEAGTWEKVYPMELDKIRGGI